jgi:hypothetical protein
VHLSRHTGSGSRTGPRASGQWNLRDRVAALLEQPPEATSGCPPRLKRQAIPTIAIGSSSGLLLAVTTARGAAGVPAPRWFARSAMDGNSYRAVGAIGVPSQVWQLAAQADHVLRLETVPGDGAVTSISRAARHTQAAASVARSHAWISAVRGLPSSS